MNERFQQAIDGFSKASKEQKLDAVVNLLSNPAKAKNDFKGFWHADAQVQQRLDEFSENTLSNFAFPFGVVPNLLLNQHLYMVPMVIEESSVVAAASKSAKFWSDKGGFHAEIVNAVKIGQVHFIWNGRAELLKNHFSELKQLLFTNTTHITANMQQRGGGILDVELLDFRHAEPGYFQLKARFNTCDSMGANFINSCLEEFAQILKDWLQDAPYFNGSEREAHVIMSILSNYTPDCLVRTWVQCPISDLGNHEGMDAQTFAWKFQKAVRVAEIDVHRATTHNKGIFNGIDAVVLATGNDFRAVEACGHTYAARNGHYQSLTKLDLSEGMFTYTLEVPMALGRVGGLTTLHPLVVYALELLGKPSAEELMCIAACTGLANNFGALRSLTTTGIQKGHMKMHLLNILNHFHANEAEKSAAVEHFKHHKVSFTSVRELLEKWRQAPIP